jgi:hypothetical protein
VIRRKQQSISAFDVFLPRNMWKERNRRVFEGKVGLPQRVLQLIKDELATRAVACGLEGRIAN